MTGLQSDFAKLQMLERMQKMEELQRLDRINQLAELGQLGNLDQANKLNFVNDEESQNEEEYGEEDDSGNIPQRKREQLGQYMKQQLRQHVQTNRNFAFTKHMRLSEAAVERRKEVSRHQKYCWGAILLTDIAFQIALLLTGLPLVDTTKFTEVWGEGSGKSDI